MIDSICKQNLRFILVHEIKAKFTEPYCWCYIDISVDGFTNIDNDLVPKLDKIHVKLWKLHQETREQKGNSGNSLGSKYNKKAPKELHHNSEKGLLSDFVEIDAAEYTNNGNMQCQLLKKCPAIEQDTDQKTGKEHSSE